MNQKSKDGDKAEDGGVAGTSTVRPAPDAPGPPNPYNYQRQSKERLAVIDEEREALGNEEAQPARDKGKKRQVEGPLDGRDND